MKRFINNQNIKYPYMKQSNLKEVEEVIKEAKEKVKKMVLSEDD